MLVIKLPAWITPHTQVTLYWEVDGCSGSTTCPAWRGQFEIDRLQAAGYHVYNVQVN